MVSLVKKHLPVRFVVRSVMEFRKPKERERLQKGMILIKSTEKVHHHSEGKHASGRTGQKLPQCSLWIKA